MNRKKIGFLSFVFSIFVGVFGLSDGWADTVVYTTAWSGNYACCNNVYSGHYQSKTVTNGFSCANNQQVTITRSSSSQNLGQCYGNSGYVTCTESTTTVTYTCDTCTKGTYTGPNGDTFCCDYYHLEDLTPDYGQALTPNDTPYNGASCSNGNFVCSPYNAGSTSYPRIRLVDKDAVSNATTGTLTNRTIQGFDKKNHTVSPNYVCVYAFGNYETGLLKPSGYTVEGCGTVGSGSTNNTTFKNCKISKVLTGKTGCKYNGTNGSIKEIRTLKTSYNYGNAAESEYHYGYDVSAKKFFGNSGDVSTGNYSAADLSNWTGKTYEFQAQPGYHRNVSSCTACDTGKYSAGGTVNSCSSCTPGNYQDQTGQSSCKACGTNTFQPNSGASYCYTAPANSTVNSARTDITCAANYYKGSAQSNTIYACLQCPMYIEGSYGNTLSDRLGESYEYGQSSAGSTSITQCYGYPVDTDSTGTFYGGKCYFSNSWLDLQVDNSRQYGSSQYCFDALGSIFMEELVGTSSNLNWISYTMSNNPAAIFQVYSSGSTIYLMWPWTVAQYMWQVHNDWMQTCVTSSQEVQI